MTHSIAIIDTRITDYETLLTDLSPTFEVIFIHEGDGLQQILDALQGRSGIDAIHILGHGSSGRVQLGSTWLSNDNLEQYREQLTQLGQSLTAEGDLLLYGCNVAAGEQGLAFVDAIAQITQADVAASDDLTGNAMLGGDWVLEKHEGAVEAQPLAFSSFQSSLAYPTITHNYTQVSGTTGWQYLDTTEGFGAVHTNNSAISYVDFLNFSGNNDNFKLQIVNYSPFGWVDVPTTTSQVLDDSSYDGLVTGMYLDYRIAINWDYFAPGLYTMTFTAQDDQSGAIVGTDYVINITVVDTGSNAPAPNAAPVITDLDGDSVDIAQGATGLVDDRLNEMPFTGIADVTDSDSADLGGGYLLVHQTSGSAGNFGQDPGILGFGAAGQNLNGGSSAPEADLILVAGKGVYSGLSGSWVEIGVVTTAGQNGDDVRIDFNANATPGDAQAFLAYLNYGSDTTGTRTFEATVNDGDGGTSTAATFTVNVTSSNAAPALGGTFTTAGTVNDDATTTPFSGVTYTDADGTSYTVNITYTAANGTLAGTGLTENSAGNYTVTGANAAEVQSRLQALVFTPTANQVAPGSTVQTTFTLTPNDGTVDGTADATTVVTATSINDAPTDIALSNATATTYDADNATVGTLSTTDADTGDSFTYSLVAGDGDTNNALFNISGSSLRATNPSGLTAGTYSVRVQTSDANSATYEEALTITVSDTLTVTTNADEAYDAGGYAAELADGAGLSLREALGLASAGGKTISFAAGLSGQTITLGSNLTLPASTTLDADAAGTLTIDRAATQTLTIHGLTVNNGTGDTTTLSLQLFGDGGLTKTGAGTLVIPVGQPANTGGMIVNDGTLQAGVALAIFYRSNLQVNGTGIFDLNGFRQDIAGLSGTGTVTNSSGTSALLWAQIASGTTSTFSGVLSGNLSLNTSGLGTLELAGNSSNTASGNISNYQGVLALNKSGGALALSGSLNLGDGAGAAGSAEVRWLQSDQVAANKNLSVNYSDGLANLNGYDQTFTNISMSAGEIRTGSGTLTLNGNFTDNAGDQKSQVNGKLALSNATHDFSVASGTLPGVDLTIAADISGSGAINKTGAGILELTGTNTYGATTVTAGTLSIAGDSNIGSGALTLGGGTLLVTGSDVTIDNNVTLTNATSSTISNANNLTLSGVLSNGGNLAKTGAGTLILTNTTSTNSGTITVNAGVVQLDGKVGGGVTVAGGTLAGGGANTADGEAAGAVSVNSGGTLSPGASGGSGVADLKTGNLAIASGGTLAMTLNGTTAGTDYDQIITTGTVSVDGATLTATGSVTPAVGDVFVLVDNDSNDAVTGTFTGLAEGATVTVNGTEMKISYVGGTGNDITLTAQMGFSGLAFSADSGTGDDFITHTAAQTVTATLSSALGSTGITIWGSLDNGSNWIEVTSMVSGTTLTWTGVTLSGSDTLKLEARNGATVVGSTSQAYIYDITPPTTTIATLAFSADTGTTDFVTNTATQDISGTLSAVTVTGEKVQVSLDNGATWVDATNTIGQNTFSLTGQTLTGSNTMKVRVVDAAGNTGTEASQAYVLDQTGPTITFSGLALSADTGTGSADFVTSTASQTISATLSGTPAGTDKVWGSVDNGVNWIDVTSMVSGTTLTWTGATLSGSNTIKLKVTDQADNDGTVASQAFVLDTTSPTASVATANVSIGSNVTTSQSTEPGIVYLVPSSQTPANYADLEALVTGGTATKATVTTGGSNTPIGTTGLTAGTYHVYAVDAAGNISSVSVNTITLGVSPTTTVATATLSDDTGVSSTDMITQTAAQDISGTLSAVTVAGETVEVSLDNGANWTTATNTTGENTWSLAGQTLSGSNTLQVRVISGGFASTAYTHTYSIDSTAPTTTIGTKALSADTGTSNTDFLTNTAAQTISGTLSTNLAADEIVQVSLDNGSTWTTATTGQNTWSLAGQTLSGSGTLKIRVTDLAGNTGTEASQAYVLDTTAPAIMFSALAFSADTGSSTSDFKTSTAAQTITATLSGAPAGTDKVYGSLDNGSTWTDITGMLTGGTTLSWTGVTLTASSTLKLKVTDIAGNDSTIASQVYVFDNSVPVFASAASSTDGNKVILTYDGVLDATNTAGTNDFIVMVGGQAATITGVIVNGSTVELTLQNAIANGQTITVAYTDPSANNDTNAVQDIAGNDAATLVSTSVTNNTPAPPSPPPSDTTPPVFQSAATSTDGTKLILTYDSPLASATVPGSAFSVIVDGQTVSITNVVINGSTLELVLPNAIVNGQTVTVAYTDPTVNNDANAIQDALGNDAASFGAQTVRNFSEIPPTPDTGTPDNGNGDPTDGTDTSNDGNTDGQTPDNGNGNPTDGTDTPNDGNTDGSTPDDGNTDNDTPETPEPTQDTVDGVIVTTTTTTSSNGSTTTTLTVPIVTDTRTEEDETTSQADIPLAKDETGDTVLQVALPVGVGVTSQAVSGVQAGTLRELLIAASNPKIDQTEVFDQILDAGIDAYIPTVQDEKQVTVRVVTFEGTDTASDEPIRVTGTTGTGEDDLDHPDRQEALVIDVRNLPSGTVLELDNVEFAIIIGATKVIGGNGRNFAVGDDAVQYIVLGAEDDVLRGGGGDDTVGSKGGDDQIFGDDGDDYLVGGEGSDTLNGGDGNDVLQAAPSDQAIWHFIQTAEDAFIAEFTPVDSELGISAGSFPWTEVVGNDTLLDPRIAFMAQDPMKLTDITLLYQAVVQQLPTHDEFNYWAQQDLNSVQLAEIAHDFFVGQTGVDSQPLDTQVQALIEQVWGEASAEWVATGVGYIEQGGTWADGLLYLVRHESHQATLRDESGNLALMQDWTIQDSGYAIDTGSNTLDGGAGNDRLIGAHLIDDVLKGGEGLDIAVYVEVVEEYTVTGQQSDAGTMELFIQKIHNPGIDTLSEIELLEIGGFTYQWIDDLAPLIDSEPQPLAEWVELIGTTELQALGAPEDWLS